MKSNELHSYYLKELEEQFTLLVDNCHAYDNGNFSQAKSLSSILRVILKDVKNPTPKTRSFSLLYHLGVKDQLKFYNTGYEAVNPKVSINLVGFVTRPSYSPDKKIQTETVYLPVLDKSQQVDVKWLTFKDWWESKIIHSENINGTLVITREWIILAMAEQGGGSHVDRMDEVEKAYLEIATAKNTIFTHHNGDKEYPIEYLHYALIRQIAHEMVITLKKALNFEYEYHPSNKHNLRGAAENKIIQPGMFGEDIESTRTKFPVRVGEFTSFTTPKDAAYVKLFYD